MHFDYKNWKHQPSRGLRGDNDNYLTAGLFYDVKWKEQYARYVVDPEEYTTPSGTLLPSAYQIIVHADDEYDAMRKLVGSMAQWERLKGLDWFTDFLDLALKEQQARKESQINKVMMELACDGDKQAAKIVLGLAKPKGQVGRPRKRGPGQKTPEDNTDDDSARVVEFVSKK